MTEHSNEIHAPRLFKASCLSLISTSVAFGVITSMMGDFKDVFALSNAEAGWIGGAALWGFTISIFVFGPLVDAIGMKKLMRFSFLCHLAGPLVMIFANSFRTLFAGALIIALANGTVEALCNPLVATIYPDKKTEKLNQFHVWFPGGIVIGGLLSFFIAKVSADTWTSMPLAAWQLKLALILIPTVIYGVLFAGQKFPVTERVKSGLSFGDMVKETFFRPMFIVLFIAMSLTATLELGPGRWMNEVMKSAMNFAGPNAGILVLVYGSGLMAVLRFFAGHAIAKFSPTGLLTFSAILSGIGLMALTFASGALAILVSATAFYVGVCYFWPTMLGVTAERVPKGGSLALAMLGGWGMAVVGLVAVPIMGMIADGYGHTRLPEAETRVCVVQGAASIALVSESENPKALAQAKDIVALVCSASDDLPKGDTAKALRAIAKYVPDSIAGLQAKEILTPADSYGGIMSFRWVASLAVVLTVIFGVMYAKDKARGGYKAESITAAADPEPAQDTEESQDA